ncbi:hypothetical protein CYMTET_28772 [Cymbomonas tetramitiformis]|uniref:PROP1-like PPR domain-containing protein n=1 Tax=Cymbomonas tetramitiformis TaxID=36881 RepID=A0AAE0FNT1_9CHLO|nr:hypothetical protein CYMTET_28772 [Cymbomonas tetramitiformis]
MEPSAELKPRPARPTLTEETTGDMGLSTLARPTRPASPAEKPDDQIVTKLSQATVSCPTCTRGKKCNRVVVMTMKMANFQKRKDPKGARKVLSAIQAEGHLPSSRTWTALISTYAKSRRPQEAQDVLAEMLAQGAVPDEFCYNAAAHAWCRARKPKQAAQVVEMMRKRGLSPSANTYGPLVSAWAEEGNVKAAEQCLRELEEQQAWPKEKMYNSIVQGLCRCGKLKEAEDVIVRMHNDALHLERVSMRGGAMRPSATTYGMLLDALCEAGKMGEARRILNKMQWEGVAPSTNIFNILIKGYTQCDNAGGAQAIFREMEGSGTWDCEKLGIQPDATTYATLMNMWAQVGDVERVEGLLRRMKNAGVKVDVVVYGTVIKAYSRARRPRDAEHVLARMAEERLRAGVIARSSVVASWCREGHMEEAERVVAEMRENGVNPNRMTYHHLVWGYGKAGEAPDGVQKTLERMTADNIKFDVTTQKIYEEAYLDNGLDLPEPLAGCRAQVSAVKSAEAAQSFDWEDEMQAFEEASYGKRPGARLDSDALRNRSKQQYRSGDRTRGSRINASSVHMPCQQSVRVKPMLHVKRAVISAQSTSIAAHRRRFGLLSYLVQ